MRLRIDLRIFIFLILFWITKQIEIYSITMLFCIIHELGHVLMGLIMGLKPEKIDLTPFGLSVSFKIEVEDYNTKVKSANKLELKRILIAIAGPLTNLVIVLLCMYLPFEFEKKNIITSNIAIMLFNLLPIYPLDGGRIVKSLLHIFVGSIDSKRYINIISNTCMMFLTILALICIWNVHNLSIAIIIVLLWSMVIKENIKFKKISKYLKRISNNTA